MPRSEIVQARIPPELKAEIERYKGKETIQGLLERLLREFVAKCKESLA